MTYINKYISRKFKVKIKYLALFSVIIALSSCGGSSGSGTTTTKLDNGPDVTGSWETNCFPSADAPGIYVTQILEINNTQYKSKTNAYTDNLCATANLIGLWEHNYTITYNGVTDIGAGNVAKNITLKFIESFHTMKTQTVVDYWNGQPGGFCGKTDWVLNEPHDVSSNSCDFVSALPGDFLYDIVSIDDSKTPNTIQFGNRTPDATIKLKKLAGMLYHRVLI